MGAHPGGTVVAVSRNDTYSFSKPRRDEIVLIPGIGVEGDTHAGVTVRHRGRVRADPTQPNLRQVHLMHAELFEALRSEGYDIGPGQLGENVTTSGVDLLGLPRGTVLRFGSSATVSAAVSLGAATSPGYALAPVLAAAASATLNAATASAVATVARTAAEQPGDDVRPAVLITGLRNPCIQINTFRPGLLKHVVGQEPDGAVVRRGGVMAVVLRGGPIRPGDRVSVHLPSAPHEPLECV
jgi:MOSC domain-containing protein YiiM